MAPLRCSHCHIEMADSSHPYTMRIEIFPSIEPSLQISEAEIEADHVAELEKLVEQLEAMSKQEVQLEEERVYSRFEFILCGVCRDKLARGWRDVSPNN